MFELGLLATHRGDQQRKTGAIKAECETIPAWQPSLHTGPIQFGVFGSGPESGSLTDEYFHNDIGFIYYCQTCTWRLIAFVPLYT